MIDSLCQGRKEEPAEGGEGDGGEGVDASSALTAAAAAAGMRRQRLTFALESTRPGEGGGLAGVRAGGFGGGSHLRVEYRRPEAGPGVEISVRTNKIQPRHKIFQSPPRQTKKRLALWFMYSDLQWRQSGTSPHAGQSGVGAGGSGGVLCQRPGAGVKSRSSQGQVL